MFLMTEVKMKLKKILLIPSKIANYVNSLIVKLQSDWDKKQLCGNPTSSGCCSCYFCCGGSGGCVKQMFSNIVSFKN